VARRERGELGQNSVRVGVQAAVRRRQRGARGSCGGGGGGAGSVRA
jgi:hypothetical protein